MEILIVTHAFPPLMPVGGMRALSWAKYWTEQGHKVTVLTSKTRTEFSYGASFQALIPEGVELIEIKNPLYTKMKPKAMVNNPQSNSAKQKKSFKRFLLDYVPTKDFYFDWIFYAKKYIMQNINGFTKFDLVITTANPLSSHDIGYFLKKRLNLKWIADYRDLVGQDNSSNRTSEFRNNLRENAYKKYLQSADFSLTVSKGLKEMLLEKKKVNNIEIIYNGYFEENYDTIEVNNLKRNIVYTGTIYDNFPIEEYLQALKILDKLLKESIDVDFYGISESYEKVISEYCSEFYFVKVNFKKALPNSEISVIQAEAGVLIFMNPKEENGILATKSFEYLAAKRPIIAMCNEGSEIATDIFSQYKHVLISYEPQVIAEHLYKTFNRLNRLEFISNFEKYTRKNQALKILDLVVK